MLKSETARVLAAIASYDRRPVTTEVVNDWHLLIGMLDFEQVLAAVRAHYAGVNRGITISEIRRHVAAIAAPVDALPPYDAAQDAQDRDRALNDLLLAHGVPAEKFARHVAIHGFASAILHLEELGHE